MISQGGFTRYTPTSSISRFQLSPVLASICPASPVFLNSFFLKKKNKTKTNLSHSAGSVRVFHCDRNLPFLLKMLLSTDGVVGLFFCELFESVAHLLIGLLIFLFSLICTHGSSVRHMQRDCLTHVCVLSVPILNGASDRAKVSVLVKSAV